MGGSAWGRPVDAAVAPDGGIYISDDASGTIYELTYSAAPPPPTSVASFTTSCQKLVCSFNASSSSGATSYGWNFGDGASGSEVTTSHAFTKKGNYLVTLNTQPAGAQSTATRTAKCTPKACA